MTGSFDPEPGRYSEVLSRAAFPSDVNLNPGPEYAPAVRAFQGVPGIACSPSGRLWATWYGGGRGEGPFNYVILATSGNQGKTWTDPVLVIDPPDRVRAFDSALWCDPSGRLWLFWSQAWSLHDGCAGVWAIVTDNPNAESATWSAPRRLCDGVLLNKPLVLANGEWHFPVSLKPSELLAHEERMLAPGLRSNLRGILAPEEIASIDERQGAYTYVSTDRGKTLTARGHAKVPLNECNHNEHILVERNDGQLWMLLRTEYGIGESTSPDLGKTWSPVTRSNIPHIRSRFFISRLPSGNLLLVRHNPPGLAKAIDGTPVGRRSHLIAQISKDDGKLWSEGLMLEEGTCSYPDGTQEPDGAICVIYDQERHGAKKIVMARFLEEDILQCDFASPVARRQILVSQAHGDSEARGDETKLIRTGI